MVLYSTNDAIDCKLLITKNKNKTTVVLTNPIILKLASHIFYIHY